MRFQIPNITKFYGGVSDTNTNSTKYILETPNNPKYKYFWLFGTPNCYALYLPTYFQVVSCLLLLTPTMGRKVQFEAVAAIECIDCDTSCAGDCEFCPG